MLFKQIVELIINKDHLSLKGLHQIMNIKASINLGLTTFQKSEFYNVNPVFRPVICTLNILDPN